MVRKGKKQTHRVGVQLHHHLAASARPQKILRCTGVRLQPLGRWAAEICVPYTRKKVWIDLFDTDMEAALAYDTAMFCFYGKDDLPRKHKFNLPDMLHPDIADNMRHQLNITDIKDIAKKHAHDAMEPLEDGEEEKDGEEAIGSSANVDAVVPINTYHGHNPNDMDVDDLSL
jgi:hypothetical protein